MALLDKPFVMSGAVWHDALGEMIQVSKTHTECLTRHRPMKRIPGFALNPFRIPSITMVALWVTSLLLSADCFAHGVAASDASYIASVQDVAFIPYMYLGAKHMVTGYDHLLFLAGVIFFLYRLKDVALYVSMFAIGHSITLLAGVLADIHANAYIVDAIIGLSVVYKAFENIGGFKRLGLHINSRLAIFLFGLAHGFGLSTKLQELSLSHDGLLANLIGFNIGVELGQFCALGLLLLMFELWRSTSHFVRGAYVTNVLLMTAGLVLFGFQLTAYVVRSV